MGIIVKRSLADDWHFDPEETMHIRATMFLENLATLNSSIKKDTVAGCNAYLYTFPELKSIQSASILAGNAKCFSINKT